MDILKKLASSFLIIALGAAAWFSQRAKTMQANLELANAQRDIEREYRKTLQKINQSKASLGKRHAQQIKQEQKKRRAGDRDDLNGGW